MNCQNCGVTVDECCLNNYFPLKKRNGMGFVVYNLKIILILIAIGGALNESYHYEQKHERQ